MSKNYNSLRLGRDTWLEKGFVGLNPAASVKKRTSCLFGFALMLFVLLGQNVAAQINQYGFSSSTGNSLLTIPTPTVVTTVTGGSADDGYNTISPAGFTFSFNGVNYTQFGVSTNGWVRMGNATASNIPSSLTSVGSNGVYIFGRDGNLNTANGGNLTHGDMGDGRYVFQYTKMSGGGSGSTSGTSYITCQIVLWGAASAAPGRIELIYGTNLGTPGSNGTIGIVDTAGTYVNAVTGNSTQTTTASAWPASGQMYVFTPPPPCTGTPSVGPATPATATVCVGATQVFTVTGGTSGVSALAYQWETSPDGLTGWVNVSGGTGATTKVYTTASYVSGTQYYRMKSTCTASSLFDYSNVVSVSGPANPSTQISNIIATTASTTSISLSWTIGNGNQRTVYVNNTNSFVDPVNGVAPGTATTNYAGSGQQLVFNGTGNAVTVTGLTVGTTYYFRAYESRLCTSPNYFYNTATAAANPATISTADKLKYTISRSTGISYTPVSGAATTVTPTTGTSDDTNFGPFTFFPFTYAGVTISSFRVCTNGFMTLNSTNANTSFNNGLTNAVGNNFVLAPFWEDLYVNNGTPNTQFVKYEITGTAPNRILTVQWENVELFSYPGPSLNFQAKLYEADSHIEYVYGVMQGFDGTNPNNGTVTNGLAFNYTTGMNASTFATPAAAGEAIGLQQANSLSFTSLGGITQNEGLNKLSVLPECSSMYSFMPAGSVRANDPYPGVPAAPSNDEPATAITLTALPTIPANFCGSFYSSAFATPSAGIAAPIASTIADDDVWFQFTANSTNTTITLRGAGGYDAAMQLFNDGNYTTVLAQKNANGLTGTSLTETINQVDFATVPGNVYKIRVYHAGGGTQATATATVTAGAITGFTVTTPGTGYITCYGGSSVTATPFVYITDPTGAGAVAKLTITGGAVSSIAIQGSQGGAGYTAPTVTIAPSSFGVTGDFSIIVNATPTPPANDEICTAQSLTATSSTCTPTAGNTFTATASPQAVCAGVADDDVWYSFVATDLNVITVQSGAPGFNAHLEVLSSSDNTCTGTLTSIACVNNTTGGGIETYTTSGLTPGNTYFIRIYNTTSGAGTGSFTVCVTSPIPVCTSNSAPANLSTNASLTPTLTWASATYATSYDVYLGTSSGGETLLGNSATTSFNVVTPLNPNTQYFWYVVPKNSSGAAACGVADETSFTTVACSSVSNVAVSNVTTSSATITWDASISAPADGYKYEVRTSGAAGSGATGLAASGSTVAGVLTANVSALTANTSYSVYVQAVCDAANNILSPWTSAVNLFTGYCVPTYSSGDGLGDEITNVTLQTLNNTTGASAAPYYTFYSAATVPSLQQNTSYPVSISFGTDSNQYAGVWIDFNHDLVFDASEGFVSTTTGGASGTTVINISVPVGAVLGNTRMRVRGGEDSQLTTSQACGASSSGFGETEDYNVQIIASVACTGTPTPGTVPASSGLCTTAVTGAVIAATGYSTGVTGISFQWEESDDDGATDAWANAVGGSGATTTTYTTPVLASDRYYRLKVTCSNSGLSDVTNSNHVTVLVCTYDTALSPATYTSIMPANGGSGVAFPGWQGTSGDDNISTTASLSGTTFKFEGQAVSGIQASSNGWMTFNTSNTSNTFSNSLSSTGQNRVLAPFWDDLVMTGTNFANRDSNIRYEVAGTLGSGSAVITVEWAGLERFNNPGPNLNFQVKLYESDNHFEFIYGNFEGFDGTLTSAYSYSTGYNGANPAGTTQIDRFALQTANANHFSAVSDPGNLIIMPSCNSMISFTPGTYSGLTSAPAVTAPANDNAVGAINIDVLGSPATSYCGTYYTSRGATDSGAGLSCGTTAGNQDDDVWFSFITTGTTDYTIKLRNSPNYNGVLELLDDTFTPITCVNATGAGLIETINATGLVSGGNTYYIRVFHDGTTIGTSGGEFSITVSEVIAGPVNDDIAGAVSLTVNATCSTTASPQPSILAATASPQPVCGGTADDDVWYSFTATSSLNIVTVQSGGGYNAYLQVFSSSDNTATGTLTSMTCNNATTTAGAESYSGPFVLGNTYFVRVYHATGGAGSGNFTICVTAPIPVCVASPTAPVNASTTCFTATNKTLSWAAVANATGYDVYLDTVDGTTIISTNQAGTSYTTAAPLAAGSYFWRVVPRNPNGSASACNTFTFTIDPASVGGSVSPDQAICSGSTPSDLTLSSNVGSVVKWQKSSDAAFTTPIDIVNTTTTLTGASIGSLTATTYFRAVVQSGSCTVANSSFATITIGTTTWTSGAWSNGAPTSTTAAIIAGNYSSTGDLSACSLTVNNNAVVTVNSGHDFNISGAVTVESGSSLTFANNANLLQSGTSNNNSGSITSTRATTMRRLDYTYWSSPVAGQNLKAFSPQTVSPPVGASRFYVIDEPTNAFVAVDPLVTSFAAAKGYVVRAPNDFTTTPAPWTGLFTGVPNNGNYGIGVTVSGFGFNLVGNPYPSPVDATAFLVANPGTLYFWTHTNQAANSGANYASFNNFGGTAATAGGQTPNGFIQTGQGFMLEKSSAGTATFTNAMRVGNNAGQFYRTANVDKHRIWLNLSTPSSEMNQILVGYMDGATQGVDESIDGKLIEGGSTISSVIGSQNYVIQGRSMPFAATDVVPLNFKAAAAGSFTISIDHVDGLFAADQDIFLKDNLTGIVHDLKAGPYSFAASEGSTASRFEVVYQNTTLGIENPTFDSNSVVVYKDLGVLSINSGSIKMSNVKIFDIRGRLIYERDAIGTNVAKLNDLKAEQQVLLVQITSDDNRMVTKKVVY